MNYLPVEIVTKILKYLPLADLLTCTKVCKLWLSIVDSFKIDGFVVSRKRKLPQARKWFFTRQKVDCRYSFPNTNLEQINLRDEYFHNFKSIFIYSTESYFKLFDIGQSLNHFAQLEQLEITYLELETQSQLTLPNLRIFAVQDVKNNLLILNTPELRYLKILSSDALKKVEIVYPKKIIWYETYQFDELICKFNNLEHLFCKIILNWDMNIFYRLKKLKRLSFNQTSHVFVEMKKQANKIRQKRTIKIYFSGFEFAELPNFDFQFNTSHLNDRSTSLYSNYDAISCDLMPFVNAIDFVDLENKFGSKIPKNFGKKFVNLNGILVTAPVKDKKQFFEFLENCSIVPCLALIYSSVDLYSDIIDTVCPLIQTLKIKEHSIERIEQLFKKYSNLYSISCREELGLSLEYEYRYENGQLEVMIRENLIIEKDEKDAILIV